MDNAMEKRTRRVIKEYIERVLKICETHRGCVTDYHIDCPGCGNYRSIVFENDAFGCHWRCGFQFPKKLTPPSPEEIVNLFNAKRAEERRKQTEELLKELDIDITV